MRGESFQVQPEPGYAATVIEIEEYPAWLEQLKETKTQAIVAYHVGKLARGLMENWKEVGVIFEMRIDFGPGYRVYFAKYGSAVFIVALGGDKSTQGADIAAAAQIWKEVRDGIKEIRG